MKLSNDFYKDQIAEIKQLIDKSISFTTIGISDFGRTVFLKHLASLPLADKFIFVDIYELATFSRLELYRLLLKQLGKETDTKDEEEIILGIRQELEKLVKINKKVVVILNRLDLVNFKFDRIFFDNLRAFRKIGEDQIVFIFGVCNPIHSFAGDSMLGSDVLFYSHISYLALYNKKDLLELAQHFSQDISDKTRLEQALELSGGHFQLFQLVLQNRQLSPIDNEFIQLALKNIYRHLNHDQKKQVLKVALGKVAEINDDYLIKTGFVKKTVSTNQLFSPLMADYVKNHSGVKLSTKENKLFKLLKNNLGEILSREQIFDKVWEENTEGATDWALDALAYRLRKNPAFMNSGYILENHKKQGYSLIKQ
jgi:hypothetical protein